MSKTEPFSELVLGVRPNGVTLYRWLYDEIRRAIIEGRLKPGTRLPSSRSVSRQHQVSRGTVVSAFEQLGAEGYMESQVGSGSIVRRIIPDKLLEAKKGFLAARADPSRAVLSARGLRLARFPFPKVWSNRAAPTFRVGQPALSQFPIDLWSRVAARRLRKATPSLLGNGDALGFRPLRIEIASYVGKTRGVKCTADEVVITSGTQQSLDLVARLLLDEQDKVWMEDPCYPGAALLFRAHGAEIVPVPVDEQGLICSAGRRDGNAAKLAYITPSHQFPLGVTMSPARRMELLKWAQEEGAWIFEDDYDGDFRFAGRPLAALQSLDSGGSVIYSNTFNKVLFPTLRLGFLVLPPRLVDSFAAAKSIIDRYPSVLDQAILCDFITEGHMGHHIRRMRELYSNRHGVLLDCARADLDGLMELSPIRGGLQTLGWLAAGIDEMGARTGAEACGIESVALSKLTINRSMPAALILGIAAADTRTIRRGVEELAGVLRKLKVNPTLAA